MATLFRRRPQLVCQCSRPFSTTIPRAVSLQWEKNDPEAIADAVPPYPYGPTRWYKQSRLGLYGGQRIQFGNNVGEKIEVKTRRKWHLNVLTRRLFSKSLNRHVQVRVSTRTLRTIDKLGGLDEYLLGEKEMRIKALGESGWWLRWAIMQTPVIKARFAEEKRRLGMEEEVAQKEGAEVAEAHAVIEEVSEAEAEAIAEEGEAVATDGAFEVEQTPGLPPLKFRVAPGKHIYLTADGWRRTRPDPERIPNLKKQQWAKEYEVQELLGLEEKFKAELAAQQDRLLPEEKLTAEESKELLRAARREWRASWAARAAEKYDTKIANRENKKATRIALKKT